MRQIALDFEAEMQKLLDPVVVPKDEERTTISTNSVPMSNLYLMDGILVW